MIGAETMTTFVVAVSVADVRRDPDKSSEQVTQALMNVPAEVGESQGDWTHITLSDYEGWIQTKHLAEPISKGFTRVGEHCGTPLDLVAVVTEPYTFAYSEADGDEIQCKLYLSTVLPLLDTTHSSRVQVALPGENSAWVERTAVSLRREQEKYPRETVRTATDTARRFLDVPYLWGGVSFEGIDCSGLTQLCYRMAGYVLPRDADQQHDALPHTVTREEMQEGDLIFFGSKAITHVALALNNRDFIHASGRNNMRVMINSLDPRSQLYHQRLDETVWAIKRVVD
jgi:cell wall-associated NlpC family hydrolase